MNDSIYILILIGVAGIATIITAFILLQIRNQNRLLQKQKQLAAAEINHQKKLLDAVINSQENERQRIGSDLHDEVGAVLSSLRMLIEKNDAENLQAEEKNFTITSKSMIDQVIVKVRQIAHNLSPHISGKHGFYDTVHELCDAINSSGTIHVALQGDEQEVPENFNGQKALALYRVLAELINNTIKHARAQHIDIRIEKNIDGLHIHYSDDGIGFIHHNNIGKGMGLQNIESRLNMIGAGWTMPVSERGFEFRITIPAGS